MARKEEEDDWNCKFLYPSYMTIYSPSCCQTPKSSKSFRTSPFRKRRILHSYNNNRWEEDLNGTKYPEINRNFNYSAIYDNSFSMMDQSESSWDFLSSPEWKRELNKMPLEPCATEKAEPTSWVHMTSTEPSEEFWTQELDFDGYQFVVDYINGICENRKQLTYPRKLINLIKVHNIPPEEGRELVLRLRETYVDKGLYGWADELDHYKEI